jgi:hypothetical protein
LQRTDVIARRMSPYSEVFPCIAPVYLPSTDLLPGV